MMRCGVRWSGSARMGMSKPIAIVAAMPIEMAPMVGSLPKRSLDGVDLYDLPQAVIVVGGIGEQSAQRAAELAVNYAQPAVLVNAGLAGAVSPRLKVGDVGRVKEIVELPGETRFTTTGGEWVLVTGATVSGPEAKQQLFAQYGADVVDMEAAAIARVAQQHGLKLVVIKSVSDVADFVLPPLGKFVEPNGKFAMGSFLSYTAVRPWWWRSVIRLGQNSGQAARNLAVALHHLIEEHAKAGAET